MNSQYAELEQILEEKPAFSFRYVTFEMASGHASGNVEEGAVHMGLGSERGWDQAFGHGEDEAMSVHRVHLQPLEQRDNLGSL